MANPATDVPVLCQDLELLRAVLNSAYSFSMTLDLQDQYRKLSQRNQWSAMTKGLEGGLEKVEAYLRAAEEQEQDELPEG